jgi:hypothetical protein
MEHYLRVSKVRVFSKFPKFESWLRHRLHDPDLLWISSFSIKKIRNGDSDGPLRNVSVNCLALQMETIGSFEMATQSDSTENLNIHIRNLQGASYEIQGILGSTVQSGRDLPEIYQTTPSHIPSLLVQYLKQGH